MHVRKTYAVFGLVLAAVLSWTASALAQAGRAAGPKPEEQIEVNADTLSVREKGNEVEAQGHVEIRREEMTLRADQVWLNRETQDMQATGNVTVDDPQWQLRRADAVRFNLGAEVGTIENGDLFLENGHLSLSGRRLQKFSGQTYHIDEGFFTTCLCESGPPTWKISAGEIDVEREGTGKVRRGVFYIMDVPVFYIPFALFPVRTERQTGFLFPEFGTSSKSGFRYLQPFYWAINKSSDATISFDVETAARVGLIGQYRAMFSKNFSAQLDASFFNENLRDNENNDIKDHTIAGCHTVGTSPDFRTDCNVIPQNRWSLVANHRQTTAAGWNSYSDVAVFSDDFFVRELTRNLHFSTDQERDIKTSRYSQSRLGFFRDWRDATLRVEGDYYQDFVQPDKRTLHKAPQIAFTGRNILWNTPLELRWHAVGINYLSKADPDGLRVDLRPELVLPFNFANFLHGAFSVAPRETLYHLFDTSSTRSFLTSCAGADVATCTKDSVRRHFARNNSRELVEINGNVGTSFGRVFSLDGETVQKIKHVVEPEMGYLFISRSKQNDIPIMDGVDRVNHRNLLTFSLTNRFWAKLGQGLPALAEDRDVEVVALPTGGDTRELARLKLAMNYGVERTRTAGGRLSDLDVNLRLMPKDFLALGGGTGIDTGSGNINQAVALFSIYDPRPITRKVLDQDFMRPNSLDLSYRYIRRGPFGFFAEDANINLDRPFPSDPVADAAYCSQHELDPRCRGFKRNVLGLIGIRALLHLTDHLLFLYDANYNAQRGGFAANRGAIKLLSQCECWSLTLAVNHSTNPDETSFKFQFDLLGLSSQSKPSFR